MSSDIDPADGMISRAALASEVLLYRMKQLSEQLLSEEWAEDLEFEVWDMAFHGRKLFGEIPATENMAKYFRDLATLGGGWWVPKDESNADQEGPFFIPLDRWKKRLNRRGSSG